MRRWKPLVLLVPLAILLPFLPWGCSSHPDPWAGKPGPPRVVVSFAPLYCFTKNVAGDHAGLITICKLVGPHDYHANVREDVAPLRTASLLLASGLDFDDKFCTQLLTNAGNPNLSAVTLVGDRAVPLKQRIAMVPGAHAHGAFDPHVWLGIPEAIEMVLVIRDELCRVDPAHTADYQKNAAAYVERLKSLLEDGRAALKSKSGERLALISNHESLAYFARAFDLNVVGVLGASAGKDLDGQRLRELMNLCSRNNVRVIATEPQFGNAARSARALREELKAHNLPVPEIVEVDPLETATEKDLEDPEWYEKKMRNNLEGLKKHLP